MAKKQSEELQWLNIRTKLNQTYQYDIIWEEAISIFDSRLKKKFLDPIQLMIDNGGNWGAGFAIVSIQCALIETFAAFRSGKTFNDVAAPKPNYDYYKSKPLFCEFLRSAGIFEHHFWRFNDKGKVTTDHPYSAIDFYSNVRCGLMHEARTKANWRIKVSPNPQNVKTDIQFISNILGLNIIYRDILHYRLLHYFDQYKDELRLAGDIGNLLRRNFARKLDHLFDYHLDPTFEWWT